MIGYVADADGELVGGRLSWWRWCGWRGGQLQCGMLTQASAAKGSTGGVWAGRVEPQYSLYGGLDLVFGEDWVGVFDFVHVWESWCVIKKSWLLVVLDVVVYLDGSPASVFPCVEGVGGGEGSDGFDDISELSLGSVRASWAGACVGSSIVGEGCYELLCPGTFL